MKNFIFQICFIILFSCVCTESFFKKLKLDPSQIQKIAEIARQKAESDLIKSMNTKFVTVASIVDKSKLAFVGSLGIPPHAVKKVPHRKIHKRNNNCDVQFGNFP